MFTVLPAYVVFFFLLVLWLGICVEVDVDRFSVPVSSLVLYIGHLEKRFPKSSNGFAP